MVLETAVVAEGGRVVDRQTPLLVQLSLEGAHCQRIHDGHDHERNVEGGDRG